MDEEPDAASTLGAFFRHVGPWSFLALAAGIAVLVLAWRVARRGGPSRHALALFAASWLAFLPVVLGSSGWSLPTYLGTTLRWGDPGLQEALPFARRPDPAQPLREAVCGAGLLLGLAGSVAALACSRRERATPAS